MIGMILVTHGHLACEFKAALEHVVGAQSQLATVCIDTDDDIEKRRKDIVEAVNEVDKGKGAILITDMFGGTPSNLAISVLEQGKIEVIAGMNLPLLVKLAGVRKDHSMEDALVQAQEAGKKYIHVASHVLAAE